MAEWTARHSYVTRGGHHCAPYSYNVTLIENVDPFYGLAPGSSPAATRRIVARVENQDTGTEYYLGAFGSCRLAVEGVFAQITGCLDHPILQNLQPYSPADFE